MMPIADARRALLDAPGLYLTGEDNLRLTTFGSIAGAIVALEGRLVTPDGQIVPLSERQTPTTDYTAKQTIFPVAEGTLSSVQLRASSGSVTRGGIYAILEVVRGLTANAQPLATLLQGYVTANARLAWPGSALESSTSGAGRLRSIVGADPAAGVEISEVVPAGVRWSVRSFAFTLVASAAAANRTPVLTIDDGANILFETGTNVAQTANQTAKYRAAVGVPFTTIGALTYLLPLPSALSLPAGARLRTVTGAIDAGDNYSAPIYEVEEFIE